MRNIFVERARDSVTHSKRFLPEEFPSKHDENFLQQQPKNSEKLEQKFLPEGESSTESFRSTALAADCIL